MNQDTLNDAILERTGHPNWDIIKKGLESEIYASQARALDATSWEEVNQLRGYAQGLALVINLRETTIQIIQQAQDANV